MNPPCFPALAKSLNDTAFTSSAPANGGDTSPDDGASTQNIDENITAGVSGLYTAPDSADEVSNSSDSAADVSASSDSAAGVSTAPDSAAGLPTAGLSTAPHLVTGPPTAPHLAAALSIAPHLVTGPPTAPHLAAALSTAPHLVTGPPTAPHLTAALSIAPHLVTGPPTAPHLAAALSTAPHLVTGPPSAPHLAAALSTAPHLVTGPPTAPHLAAGLSTAPHLVAGPSTAPHLAASPSTAPHLTAGLSTAPHLAAGLSTALHLAADASTAQVGAAGVSTALNDAAEIIQSKTLTTDDAYVVLEMMFDAREKWRFIGGFLRLSQSTLNNIDAESRTNEEKLYNVIIEWLCQYGRTPSSTWSQVALALRNKTVGREDLAQEVCEKYHIPLSVPPARHTASASPQLGAVVPVGMNFNPFRSSGGKYAHVVTLQHGLDYCYPKLTNQIASLEVTIRDSYLARGNY